MSRRAGSKETEGTPPFTLRPMRTLNDETASTHERADLVLQSHFNYRGDDTWLVGGISMETRSKRASVSFESNIISNGASSWRRPATERGASRGVTRVEDLLIDIEADFSGDEVHPDLGARRHSLRPRFPPRQAGADACIGALDKGIKDTHL